jgi:hypothetical protein
MPWAGPDDKICATCSERGIESELPPDPDYFYGGGPQQQEAIRAAKVIFYASKALGEVWKAPEDMQYEVAKDLLGRLQGYIDREDEQAGRKAGTTASHPIMPV